MILVTCSSVTAEKEANVGGRESGVTCRKPSEAEKTECIFSIFSVKRVSTFHLCIRACQDAT